MHATLQQNVALVIGRLLLSIIFILAGIQKITGYGGTVGYMEAMGVPGIFLPLVILVEVVGGLAILFGFQTRIAALLLGGFSVLAALLFHFQPSDQIQMIMLMKNFAIAGGFLALFVAGPGSLSIDARRA